VPSQRQTIVRPSVIKSRKTGRIQSRGSCRCAGTDALSQDRTTHGDRGDQQIKRKWSVGPMERCLVACGADPMNGSPRARQCRDGGAFFPRLPQSPGRPGTVLHRDIRYRR
jgi:hypothetical protein